MNRKRSGWSGWLTDNWQFKLIAFVLALVVWMIVLDNRYGKNSAESAPNVGFDEEGKRNE